MLLFAVPLVGFVQALDVTEQIAQVLLGGVALGFDGLSGFLLLLLGEAAPGQLGLRLEKLDSYNRVRAVIPVQAVGF